MAIIYLFGDSITYGAWGIQNSGWTSLVRKHMDEKQAKDPNTYYLVYNLGIPGDTTGGLATRFKSEFEARERQDRGETNVFVFAFGANDSAFSPGKGVYKVQPDAFKAHYQSVLDIARQKSKNVILLNTTPVDEAICAARYRDKVRLNSNISKYNSLIKELADANKLPLIDVYAAYMTVGPQKLLSEDGLHPNDEGHKVIFELLKEKFGAI